ncbi:MAG: hypothetical protein NT075_15090, partial [Chloroflexi bacterium]|nr:hypothetical protein [Chloroflexota bacterium]
TLIGFSAQDGTADEHVVLNTWNNTGDYYIRVSGRNGTFNNRDPFQLKVTVLGGACGSFIPANLPPSGTNPTAGNFKTIILQDVNRMEGSAAEKSALVSKLQALAGRSEVQGVLVDLSLDPRIVAVRDQAIANSGCPYATNLWATEAQSIIKRYWELNSALAYVVLVGNDGVIPFFRYPDRSPVSPESDFEPPVLDNSISEANLRLKYVLSQDAYGARTEISLQDRTLPLPELAVGRLVETAAEASTVVDAYLSTGAGVAPRPSSALVTSYGFLEDGSRAVLQQLQDGLTPTSGPAPTIDSLIDPAAQPPEDPHSWTADQLRNLLLGSRHDLIFLAGHFNPSRLLAADYTTTVSAAEIAASPVNFTNALIYSSGCHSGYNIVNDQGVPGVTDAPPDWTQAFARKGATLIAGTGYQYGDADATEYSERLYLNFTQQLRIGTGPVAIGKALLTAKRDYLATTGVEIDGIFEKTILVSTLFGLPMLSVDLPNRIAAPTLPPVVSGTSPVLAGTPGATLKLHTADITITPTLQRVTKDLINAANNAPVQTVYYTGANGVVARPGYPILPLEIANVTNVDGVVRGVGFRGGVFADESNIQPHTSVPATELAGSHPVFYSPFFFPVQPWQVNYYDYLTDPLNGTIRLMVTPVQYKSNAAGSVTGTLRHFTSMQFRLYYSQDKSAAALAAPPTIAHVGTQVSGDTVQFSIEVNRSNEVAGVQEVWVTYSTVNGTTWQPLDLIRNPNNPGLWEGTLTGVQPADLRFIVQAASGTGLISLDTNQGDYYTPGIDPGALPLPPSSGQPQAQATTITLQNPPNAGAFGEQAAVTARLTSNGTPLAGQLINFGL